MDGERTIAAKTRPRKRTGHRRPATEVAPAATEMRTAAEMPAAMAATVKMPSAAVTTTAAASMATSTVTPAAATFRSGIARGRQRGRENKDGNSSLEF
jgi:hypothetical protein